ncbi:MAG: xylose isomerase, partial [Chloroflexota bacterium]|nr:xylose isomerase [Chloroflexota bacterium]
MRVGSDNYFHLTYCTNIHPSNGWEAVLANLGRYAPPLRERLAPEESFGIGLRLSGIESTELLQEQRLVEFRSFLDDRGLYVFTLNGFP